MNLDAVDGREAKAPAHSQTLSRGIRALEILAESQSPMTIAELSDALGVHRSIAYRILRTLEDHSLLIRDDAGRVQAGPGLAALARGVARDLQTAALPELTELANELSMTAFIAVWDHRDSVTLLTVEPRHSGATLAQRPGTRHSFSSGAPGIAIQSAMSEDAWARLAPGLPYRPEARAARTAGFATSHDEVLPGVSAIAAPIHVPGGMPAAICVVFLGSGGDPSTIGARLVGSARAVEAQLQ
ncbi:IclR family transcriptional regulator [Arthrobacter glacialis]|uniref:ArsR family transcriptional regulator n=1 Tax=Arthrobacter glacialis TaxID=1664 RepID=A0A2S4A1F8_ARTGL|nr:helix-turn-helix domain-containing protein [Arthrobacter glacialis]POH61143.1 ArsR family transcriptional regulator [Arthrobacter glacialis]POH75278.1 ArsR family transcriptional regulator [Arthrobacter glacialis]